MNFLGIQISSLRTSILILILGILVIRFQDFSRIFGKVLWGPPHPGPIVKLSTGFIQGKTGLSRESRVYNEFLGIPYAKAPVGDLRFEPPQEPEDWEGVRPAKSYGSQCTQIELFTSKILGDEDCLFLNVFVPDMAKGSAGGPGTVGSSPTPFPVMVFFHGGYLMSGGSNNYRPNYFMDHNVILVTLNYRVASLGFLNTGDGLVRGNMGLKDQVMSLRWIKKNIEFFGGDPNKVTIFGASAGAAAVHYHILSPMSKGLFHRAISQSGTAIKILSFVSEPMKQAQIFGERVNCLTKDNVELVKCLKGKKPYELIAAHWPYLDSIMNPDEIYAPSIEAVQDNNTFLSSHPLQILRDGNQNRVPWISGVNSEDGLVFTAKALRNSSLISKLNTELDDILPVLLGYKDLPNGSQITSRIREFYFGGKLHDFHNDFKNFTDIFSDRLYFVATHEAAKLHSTVAPVYMYLYSYKTDFTFSTVFRLSGKIPHMVELSARLLIDWVWKNVFRQKLNSLGICHGDELLMFFNFDVVSDIQKGHKDFEMSKTMVKLWTDFARHEKFLKVNGSEWEPTKPQVHYLNLDRRTGMITEPFSSRVDFWNSIGIV